MAARLELRPDLSEVARLNAWLAETLPETDVAGDAAQAAKLCLNELVANVILYGYPGGGEGGIVVTVASEDGALRVTVEDDGMAFDPLAAPEAQAMTGLADAQVGGYGIKLFRENSHGARYERAEGRNRLSFLCG